MSELQTNKRKHRTYAEGQESLARNLPHRCEKFKESVWQFRGVYPDELLEDFIDYWTEPNRTQTRMRFEMEKTWDTARRLNYWNRRSEVMTNNSNYGKNRRPFNRQQQLQDEADERRRGYEEDIARLTGAIPTLPADD